MAVWAILLQNCTFLLSTSVLVLSLLWWLSTRRPRGIPPGPGPALPFLGHLHLMKGDPMVLFARWRRQYGDVFSLYLGGRLMVVLNGYHTIKEALVKQADAFSDRPVFPLYKVLNLNLGILNTSGAQWKATRTTSLHILREFGMGSNLLAQKVQQEVNEYTKALAAHDGQDLNMARLTQMSVSNNICSVVFGKRFEYEDPAFQNYMKILEEIFRSGGGTRVALQYPVVRHIPGDPFKVRQRLKKIRDLVDRFIKPAVEQHDKEYTEGAEDDFINAYIREMRKDNTGLLASRDGESNLVKLIGDLFSAGTETTSTAIRWAVIYMLHNPHVQDKCHEELMRIVGDNRAPDIRDRPEMTYLEATIMETLRMANIAPLAVPHATAYDVSFHGYRIPKGVTVIVNLDSVLKEPAVWEDVDCFKPERFIGPDDKLTKPEEFIPFSIGRRVCLGEAMARTELFLYLATLMQRFRFLPPEDGQLPSLQGTLGVTYMPQAFTVRVQLRK